MKYADSTTNLFNINQNNPWRSGLRSVLKQRYYFAKFHDIFTINNILSQVYIRSFLVPKFWVTAILKYIMKSGNVFMINILYL